MLDRRGVLLRRFEQCTKELDEEELALKGLSAQLSEQLDKLE